MCAGSSNTSKYFGSVDSLEHDSKAEAKPKTRGEGVANGSQSMSKVPSKGDPFIKYVLQEPLWLLMSNTDDKIMMTYQMPPR